MGYLRIEPFLPNPENLIEDQPAEALLAMCLWGEARGQDVQAKVAVASVILNRAGARAGRFFPKDAGNQLARVRGVILKPWQFSCFNGNDPNRPHLLTPTVHDSHAVWEECVAVAACALDGMFRDPTRGADHYFSPVFDKEREVQNLPAWARGQVPVLSLKGFMFYRIG